MPRAKHYCIFLHILNQNRENPFTNSKLHDNTWMSFPVQVDTKLINTHSKMQYAFKISIDHLQAFIYGSICTTLRRESW